MFRLEVYPVGHRVVVDHHGLLGHGRDGAQVLHGLARIGDINHRGHDHVAVYAQLIGAFDIAQRLARAGLGNIGQHRYPARADFQRALGHRQFLFKAKGAGFTQRATGHQAMDAVADLKVQMLGSAL